MAILHHYTNGNCEVTLHDDGCKTREWPDSTEPRPRFPESVDLKITNRCDKGCAWCHENASEDGRHASADRILSAVCGLSSGLRLPAGVEIAIGGGNPLTHPGLMGILLGFQEQGIIANMTIQADALFGSSSIVGLQKHGLLHGVGISDASFYVAAQHNGWLPANAVAHVIVGIDEPLTVIEQRANGANVLVLGYKRYGRGESYYGDNVAKNTARWRYFIQTLLREAEGVLSFDNLALEQLDIKNRIPADVWSKHYMGDDGAFTMYFDAVANQYAVSSVGERQDAGSLTLVGMFRRLQKERADE